MWLALAGLAVAWAVMLLFGGMELDRALLLVGYAGQRPEVATYARWLTELGGAAVLLPATAFGGLVLLLRREWRAAVALAAITLSGRLLVDWQKEWTGRLRPEDQAHLVEVQTLAFPSGHAANATLVWLSLALLLPRTDRTRAFAIWGAVWLALAVGVSRVLLGVHWPSDVIGGWAFGLFWALLLLRLSGHSLGGSLTIEGTPPLPAHSFSRLEENEDVGQDPSR